MVYAPIILFIYNRPDHTRQTLDALASNTIANESDLFIFADGPKDNSSEEQLLKIKQTREIAHSKKWCKKVSIIESEKNKGLAASIISGVTEIINKYGKVIVLEDDIVTGKYFLEFMNEALDKYENEQQVWHITGWRDPIKNVKTDTAYFYPTMDCWSWATWADRWQYFKKDIQFYKRTFTDEMKYHFNIEGSEPGLWEQIELNDCGKINTWAIFWYASIFLKNGLCLAPTKSLVRNIGLDNSGVHCGESPKQKIKDKIDYKITQYPEEIRISSEEYRKNINFFVKLRKTPVLKKIKADIKMKIKKNIILKPLYYFLKKIYYKLK